MKFNGKANWAPPTEHNPIGLWDLSQMEEGKLEFNFTLDPVSFKAEMSKINKLAAAAAESGNPITDETKLRPKPKEMVSVKTLSRQDLNEGQFERLANTIVRNYREENDASNEDIIKDLISKHSLWTS